jgi:Zn-dependent M28 family amino/carboxypeptidase
VLLELARVLASRELPLTTELVFADGEEAFGANITRVDGLYGSTALAERMKQDGSLATVRSVILVDMVGDKDLNLVFDLGSSATLRDIFVREAEKLGYGGLIDEDAMMGVVDDHSPFHSRGVEEVLALIDFQFGARVSPGPLWHTAGDDLTAVSAASLNSVGRVLVEAVRAIEEHWRDSPSARAPEG